jgi:hypothetical protein
MPDIIQPSENTDATTLAIAHEIVRSTVIARGKTLDEQKMEAIERAKLVREVYQHINGFNEE